MRRYIVRAASTRFVLAGVLACTSLPCWALDLSQAYQAALEQDATIRAARAAADARRERLPQARASLLPNLSASVTRFKNNLDRTAPNQLGQSVTTAAANLRSGPGTSYSVLKVVPAGSMIGHSETLQNDFRYVSHNGVGGWMYNVYTGYGGTGAGPEDGPVPSSQTTTANLNLRAEPSSSAPILLVVPAGAKVVPNGAMAYGYAQVTYNGVKGWVLAAYLQ